MRKELEKNYNPADIEGRLYQKWLDKKYFHAKVNKDKKPFTIVMPPPNITGKLHMGHALDNTMQDIIIRFKRMQGYEALWLPGTDHASISTEVKVTNALKDEGIDKHELGREGFLKRTWEWKEEYGGTITSQLKKMGSSCDWDRERFTMDEGCSAAVQKVFINLYKKGFIYKGKQATDGRYSVLYLTKEGKALVPKLQKIENCFDEELSQFLKNNIDVNEMMSCFQEYLKGTRSEKKLKLRSLWD